jgi:hypothetical protein
MNTKRLVVAIIIIYFVSYGLATLYTEVIFADQFDAFNSIMRPEPQSGTYMAAMLLGYLVMTSMFCYIFTKGYENKGLAEGVRYGLLMGILLGSVEWVYGISLPLSMTLVVLITLLALIIWVIAGLILAAVYKPKTA